MTKRSLGEFEQLVLLAILRVGDAAYAVPVINEIEAQTGRKVSHAAVYIALRRLEEKGLVTSNLAGATPERGGRGKRYYEIEPAARDMLQESRNALTRMWDGLELVN
jgi:DNA-binding PadR family transcriptional regulator